MENGETIARFVCIVSCMAVVQSKREIMCETSYVQSSQHLHVALLHCIDLCSIGLSCIVVQACPT